MCVTPHVDIKSFFKFYLDAKKLFFFLFLLIFLFYQSTQSFVSYDVILNNSFFYNISLLL